MTDITTDDLVGFIAGSECSRKELENLSLELLEARERIAELENQVKGFKHNIRVADSYLVKIDEAESSKEIWDNVENAREFLELEDEPPKD